MEQVKTLSSWICGSGCLSDTQIMERVKGITLKMNPHDGQYKIRDSAKYDLLLQLSKNRKKEIIDEFMAELKIKLRTNDEIEVVKLLFSHEALYFPDISDFVEYDPKLWPELSRYIFGTIYTACANSNHLFHQSHLSSVKSFVFYMQLGPRFDTPQTVF